MMAKSEPEEEFYVPHREQGPLLGEENVYTDSVYNHDIRPRKDNAYAVLYVFYMLTALAGGFVGFLNRNTNFFQISTLEYLQVLFYALPFPFPPLFPFPFSFPPYSFLFFLSIPRPVPMRVFCTRESSGRALKCVLAHELYPFLENIVVPKATFVVAHVVSLSPWLILGLCVCVCA
jgi:hypothetical protein